MSAGRATVAQAQRFAAYSAARDSGATPWDAASAAGLRDERRYERAWRKARGLPDRDPVVRPYERIRPSRLLT